MPAAIKEGQGRRRNVVTTGPDMSAPLARNDTAQADAPMLEGETAAAPQPRMKI